MSVTPVFLSTPSVRRATQSIAGQYVRESISIHALREEGDGKYLTSCDKK